MRDNWLQTKDLDEAYVKGHELLKFCSKMETNVNLTSIQRRLSKIAVQIDEAKLNQFIDQTMDVPLDDEEDEWEAFPVSRSLSPSSESSSWSFDVPPVADTTVVSEWSQLSHIATIPVEYETDSDAQDSWAQESVESFGQALSRHSEQLENLRQQLEALQTGNACLI